MVNQENIILIDKPSGLTSFQVVEKIKKGLGVKAGHTGTLDPSATGLLIILTGKRTKEAATFLHMDKTYEVNAVLGIETDSFDSEGQILARCESKVSRQELETALNDFRGKIWQVPPAFSAKKIAGRKAYHLARKGIQVDMPPREVTTYSLQLKDFCFPFFTLTCEVSSGFYVRSLIHDIGKKLATGACVQEVRRTHIGQYKVEQATKLEDILL